MPTKSKPRFTPAQALFLAKRPGYPSNVACARALDIHPGTPQKWRANIPGFKDALESGYALVVEQAENPTDALATLQPKALLRYAELLDIPISPQMKPGDKGEIRKAAEKILIETGVFERDSSNPIRIDKLVIALAAERDKYVPPWIEGTARIIESLPDGS